MDGDNSLNIIDLFLAFWPLQFSTPLLTVLSLQCIHDAYSADSRQLPEADRQSVTDRGSKYFVPDLYFTVTAGV